MTGHRILKTAMMLLFCFCLYSASVVQAAVPEQINYQGYLTDSVGVPLNGPHDIYFAIHDSSGTGVELWGEWHYGVSVTNGVFNVQLGASVSFPPNLFDGNDRYLELTIINDAGDPETLSPMQQITSTAFAIRAGDADMLGGNTPNAFAQTVHGHSWSELTERPLGLDDGDDVGITIETDPTVISSVKDGVSWAEVSNRPVGLDDGDDVGITSEGDPTVLSSVKDGVSWNELTGIPLGFADGVDNVSSGDLILPFQGSINSEGNAFYIENGTGNSIYSLSQNNIGVVGQSGLSQGGLYPSGKYGGYFRAYGDSSVGIYGYSDAYNGIGVSGVAPAQGIYGLATNEGDVWNHGGYFEAKGMHGYGIFARATNETGTGTIGGRFQSAGTIGYGIHVQATNTGNYINYGGFFEAYGAQGRAVYGIAKHGGNVQNYGGYFEAAGAQAHAVHGIATDPGDLVNYGGFFSAASSGGIGVYGENSNWGVKGALGNGRVGVWGEGTGDNYAGYFWGNVRVEGHAIVQVVEIMGGADLSEQFDIQSPEKNLAPLPGMVVSINTESPEDLIVSNKPYDRKVAGIISGAGGVKTGMLMGQRGSKADGAHPVALSGRVYCLVDASAGPIEPGDLLTTSEVPGHAMKVRDYVRAQGAILGKAMTSLEEGQDLVLVLVTLQ